MVNIHGCSSENKGYQEETKKVIFKNKWKTLFLPRLFIQAGNVTVEEFLDISLPRGPS